MPSSKKSKSSQQDDQDFESYIKSVQDQPSLLFTQKEQKTQKMLKDMLQHSFQSQYHTQQKQQKKIVFSSFSIDQVWAQIQHHTESLNKKTLNKLQSLTQDEEFVKMIDEYEPQQLEEEDDQSESQKSDDEQKEISEQSSQQEKDDVEKEFMYGDEEGEEAGEGDSYGEEGDLKEGKDLNIDQIDQELEDIEEQDEVAHQLKMPDDLEGNDKDRFDMGNDEDYYEEEAPPKDIFGEGDGDEDDAENDIFAAARENKELKFANEEMIDKIKKIENEMMDEKKWQMKGEIQCKDRGHNSLLEEYVDFDTASKMPPQITQETTNIIEAMIRQRILDELFDDPIRRVAGDVNRGMDDFALDFTKSGKGLGDQYAEEYQSKLMKENPDLFLDNDVAGVDSSIKKEIDDIFNGLMRNLNQLSNIHYTPKRLTKENTIKTQNVASLKMEEAIPIGVSTGQTKSAKEIFQLYGKDMKSKEELTKEEKRRDRATRKRQIRQHLHSKEIARKEKNREQGIAQVGDRFMVKQIQQQVSKKKKEDKKDVDLGLKQANSSKEFKSGNFFKKMVDVSKSDREKKDLKRSFKETGKASGDAHNHGSAKRFKM